MQLPALCCGVSLLLLVLPHAGAQAAGGERSAELQSLQELLEALEQLLGEEGGLPGLEAEPEAGAEAGGAEWDELAAESSSQAAPLPGPSAPQAEGQSRWRSLLSSYRRRPFSGCFGTRMERIGAQTGLGCNHYKARFWRKGRS
ncbi:PREDICTED: natriuretic peptides A-like [Tinamus guttatus]|uniref:natriuretic peptides A-like n=1 Tax=Tinamus guttatus TaxID=94827 RepID=UPI00052EF307|nr:PREDICTED: natriuretic peptides A-like [Tinamus guttatus]